MGAHFTPDSFFARCEETADLAAARALHARRALYEAFDHGLALGDALGLSPLALDLIDEAIGFMDAVDAPDEDMEPSLGQPEPSVTISGRLWRYHGRHYVCRASDQSVWGGGPSADLEEEHGDLEDDGTSEPSLAAPERHPSAYAWARVEAGPHQDQRFWSDGSSHDSEQEVTDEPHDAGDDTEETLGWAANMRQVLLGPNTADGDVTAPERHGKGFVRCGQDDYEPSLGAPEQQDGVVMRRNGRWTREPETQVFWARGDREDRELGDDNGLGDSGGLIEQVMRHRDRDCQGFCAAGHDDGLERTMSWRSRKSFWTGFWPGGIRRMFLPVTACWTT